METPLVGDTRVVVVQWEGPTPWVRVRLQVRVRKSPPWAAQEEFEPSPRASLRNGSELSQGGIALGDNGGLCCTEASGLYRLPLFESAGQVAVYGRCALGLCPVHKTGVRRIGVVCVWVG
jgi:hypothetical protein